MSTKKRKGHKNISKLILGIVLILFLLGGGICFYIFNNHSKFVPFVKKSIYLGSNTNETLLYVLSENEEDDNAEDELLDSKSVIRGTKAILGHHNIVIDDIEYQEVVLSGIHYYVDKKFVVDSYDKVVLEDNVYVRSTTSVLESTDSDKIVGLAKKGETLQVDGYDKLEDDGSVHLYKIHYGDIIGYVYGKYMSYTKEEASLNYKADVYDAIHSKVSNSYGGGEAIKLDFYPNDKPIFESNKMPDAVYALYLNSGVINDVDSYIEFAKGTKINAFVVDIKDNESPAFSAKTFENMSPTNYKKAFHSYDEYKAAIQKLKQSGFYVIGRITTFKDSYYVTDHSENAILDKSTGKPFLHNGSYWPSAYNRDVWYYTLSLAKEAVREFGFNEINFDYVRFPDRMNSVMSRLDLKNTYDEDKVEAIQRFSQYVTDALHEMNVYVSIDVFGESTNSTYTTAYGQYWPGISNVVDAISGMPYPDHFSNGSYGISKPWNHPYQLMKYWASYAMDRQKECPTPAKVRTWIQAYDVMKYVDANGISYDAQTIEQEIRGLYDAGAIDGYITWLSNSSLAKYRSQEKAFQIDYRKEYMDAKNNSE